LRTDVPPLKVCYVTAIDAEIHHAPITHHVIGEARGLFVRDGMLVVGAILAILDNNYRSHVFSVDFVFVFVKKKIRRASLVLSTFATFQSMPLAYLLKRFGGCQLRFRKDVP
jgi:hypothetical protein